MDEVKYLSLSELCFKLKISDSTAKSMLKDGRLTGIKVGKRNRGEYRIVDPGPKFEAYLRSLEERTLHLPLLSAHEAAEVVGTSYYYLHQLIKKGQIKPMARVGKLRVHLFTVAEIRRYLMAKQKLARPRKKLVRLERLIQWAKQILAQQNGETVSTAALDEMAVEVDRILKLPEPVRSQSLQALFLQLDRAQLMVQASTHKPESGSSQPSLHQIPRCEAEDT